MINSIEEKKFIENQIRQLENILLDLKNRLLPEREEQFNVMAAVYVRKITEMREEIEAYTGMELLTIQKKDINIHINGPAIDYGSIPISLISSYLESFRLAIQKTHKLINDKTYKNIPQKLKLLTDFKLVAFQPGSINLSLSLPDKQLSLLGEDKIEDAIEMYFKVLEWLVSNKEIDEFEFKDGKKFEKMLLNILSTLPDDKKISNIEFFGNAIKTKNKIVVNNNCRKKLKRVINNINSIETVSKFEGNIRELDLDKRTFCLRNMKGNTKEIKCKLAEENAGDINKYLDSKVSVVGIEKGSIVEVKYIEILE